MPPTASGTAAAGRTASGSVAVADAPARVARASRILVEGLHDAELVEKVWGDDLRIEGVVVEMLDGADHLGEIVRALRAPPGPAPRACCSTTWSTTRRSPGWPPQIDHPDVLVTGHPYVDIWAAVKPAGGRAAGLARGAQGRELEGRGLPAHRRRDPRAFWKQLLGSVDSYADLEPPLVGAVEQLIDFVTEPT